MPPTELVIEQDLLERLPVEACDRVIQIVDVATGKGTLEELFDNETLKTAATKDGEFSQPQLAAITATSSIMQDKLTSLLAGMIALLHEQTVRGDRRLEESIESSKSVLIQFLQKEMFTGRSDPLPASPEDGDPNDGMIGKKQPKSLLTWGNFLAVCAMGICAFALYMTEASANYQKVAEHRKDTIAERDQDIAELKKELAEVRNERDQAKQKASIADALATSYKKQLDANAALSNADPNGVLEDNKRLNGELTDAKVAASVAETQLENMEEDRDRYKAAYGKQFARAEKNEARVDELELFITDLKNKGIIR